MSDPTFETRLSDQLRAYAEGGVRQIDRYVIAEEMIAAGRPSASLRRQFGTFDKPSMTALRWLVVALLLAVTVLAAAVAAGALIRRDPVPQPGTANGWVAYAQHSLQGNPDARNTPMDIYLIREGAVPRRIAGSDDGLTRAVCPTFSPDGTRLAYAESTGRTDGGSGSYVWANRAVVVVELDATGLPAGDAVRIPVSPDGSDACPAWSFDGRTLAFLTGESRNLAIARADGSTEPTPIGTDMTLQSNVFAWSPRGDFIARAGPSDIWLVAVDGGQARQIATGDDSFPGELAWSPDGSRIAYQSRGPIDSVRVVELDGTIEELGSGFGPAWSPDGRRIAFTRTIAGTDDATEIVVMDPDGADPHVIVLESLGGGVATSSITTRVVWSPDGMRLLYVGCCNASLDTPLISVSATGDAAPIVLVTGYPSISDTGLSWQSVGRMDVIR